MFGTNFILNSYNQLSLTTKSYIHIYVLSALTYNLVESYYDAFEYLKKYEKSNLSTEEKRIIKSPLDAAKYGVLIKFYDRIWYSLTWPFSLAINIVPMTVVYFHSTKKTS